MSNRPPEVSPLPESTRKPWTPGQEKVGTIFLRLMSAANTWIFRASGGRIGNKFARGAPVLLLTTAGARSAKRRTTPLIYLDDGDDVVLVASKGGMSHSPGWYHNLLKTPDCEVQVGSEARPMQARRASDEEKAALWPRLLEIYRDYDDYQARTSRNIPVMVLSPRS
jgi:deazaflavin-dependent oxidoreductase (nitroreductase family)